MVNDFPGKQSPKDGIHHVLGKNEEASMTKARGTWRRVEGDLSRGHATCRNDHNFFAICEYFAFHQVSLVAQTVKTLPAMRETWVLSLDWEDPLEKKMAIHSNILDWRIPTDRGACQAIVHGVTKSRTRLID